MATVRCLLVVLSLGFFAGCGRSGEDAGSRRPAFIERIQPADYAAAELRFDEPFSRRYDLVFLRTDFGQPVSALALRREPAGGYALLLSAKNVQGTWQTVTTELDRAIGEQVSRAVELKLHRNILINGQPHDITKNDGDLWVYQRLSDGRAAAALIRFEATLGNPEAKIFVDDLVGGLQQLIPLDSDARREALTRLDRVATEIILTETPR